MWPGFDSRTRRGVICGLSLLLIHVLAPPVFSPGPPVFPPSSKTNISKFQFDLETEGHRFISRRQFSVALIIQSRFYLRKTENRAWSPTPGKQYPVIIRCLLHNPWQFLFVCELKMRLQRTAPKKGLVLLAVVTVSGYRWNDWRVAER